MHFLLVHNIENVEVKYFFIDKYLDLVIERNEILPFHKGKLMHDLCITKL